MDEIDRPVRHYISQAAGSAIPQLFAYNAAPF
jgi:hypothetical protein